jgi:hypothetical protein
MNWVKIFDSAYDKCARLLPGQDVRLTDAEEEALLAAIRRATPGIRLRRRLSLGLRPDERCFR